MKTTTPKSAKEKIIQTRNAFARNVIKSMRPVTTNEERVNSDFDIVIDSVTSVHVVSTKIFLSEMETAEEINVETAGGSIVSSKWKRSICDQLYEGIILKVGNVYFIPGLTINLLSCTCLDVKNIFVSSHMGSLGYWVETKGNSLMGYANE